MRNHTADLLTTAAKLVTDLRITRAETVCISVDYWTIQLQLTSKGLARVFHELDVPRNLIRLREAEPRPQVVFNARGVTWACVVDDIVTEADWQSLSGMELAT